MHGVVVLDSGVHCVRCQLRDLRGLTSSPPPKKIPSTSSIYIEYIVEALCQDWRTERGEGPKEERHRSTLELNLVSYSSIHDSSPLSSLFPTARFLIKFLQNIKIISSLVVATAAVVVQSHNRKFVSPSLFPAEAVRPRKYAIEKQSLGFYDSTSFWT